MFGNLLLGEYMLLQKMRKTQNAKTDIVGVDFFGDFLCAVEVNGRISKTIQLKEREQRELEPALRSLIEKGYIEELPKEDLDGRYRITYKGLHVYQPTIKRVLLFLVTSVLVPAVVAVIAALTVARLPGG